MEIREITGGPAETGELEKINEEAFSPEERCPLDDLLKTGATVFRINEGGKTAGFMAVRYYRNLVYLAYLAVRSSMRACGIGSRALSELISRHPDKQVVVEYEAPDSRAGNNDERIRRRRFYRRAGFYETGWYTHYDNTLYEVGCSRPDFDSGSFTAFAEELAKTISDHVPNPFQKHS